MGRNKVYKKQCSLSSSNVIPFPTVSTEASHLDGWKEMIEYLDKLRSESEWDYNGKKNDGE